MELCNCSCQREVGNYLNGHPVYFDVIEVSGSFCPYITTRWHQFSSPVYSNEEKSDNIKSTKFFCDEKTSCFRTFNSLTSSENKNNSKRDVECMLCEYKTFDLWSLRSHVRTVHHRIKATLQHQNPLVWKNTFMEFISSRVVSNLNMVYKLPSVQKSRQKNANK